MREVISIHIGQAGVQVGLCIEFTFLNLMSRWETHAGNYTASSTAFNLMDKCQVIRRLEGEMMHSIHSSPKLEQASMCLEQSWLIWSLLYVMK